MKKLVHFGAGKIGRSFIGQLFSRAGYEVVFVDIDRALVEALNREGRYRVVIKSDEGDETLWIERVRASHADQVDAIASEICTCDIVGVSVGPKALKHIVALIARGLEMRLITSGSMPLDIILAENMRDAATYTRNALAAHLPVGFPLDDMAGLIETSIGKMVPIMSARELEMDGLVIFAEPYNTLILDEKAFKNPIPDVPGLAPKKNMKAWVDRKSFIHNLGHAATAYCGHLYDSERKYLYEVLSIPDVQETVRAAMLQSAQILLKAYAEEFTLSGLKEHIEDLLQRFSNRALGDTIFRVGRDLYRKLGPDDRLIGAMKMGIKHKMPVDKILHIAVCGTFFKATDEHGKMDPLDRAFMRERERGLEHIFNNIFQLSERDYAGLLNMGLKFEGEIKSRLFNKEKH